MNKIIVEVSIGELLDKISILEIKQEKIKDKDKLKFISEDWVKSEPNADESNFHLGLANYNQGNESDAYNLFKKVVSQNKKHTLSYFYLYKIAKANSNKNEMVEYKKNVEQLDSNINLEMDE